MNKNLLFAFICIFLSQSASAQLVTEWVEQDPANDPNKIALGYPVPIPLDTPVPFDGFRTYTGLHTRHQDLAATTPWVHPQEVGTTHAGRTIWAYRLGDGDFEDIYGLPEPATLTNGGIHAREWQSPEVVTGIMEMIAGNADDHHLYQYLVENVNMIVIPSLNIDGFMQTQRFPSLNLLGSDPDNPETWLRDGRMRRKNMRGVDEALDTVDDHLLGVDLNRNNAPFWNTNPDRSSSNNESQVHHGAFAQSEPETQALDVAAQLGPIEQLRLYTDVHSFSQVHFWGTSSNTRLADITESVLGTFTEHHFAFPAGKFYFFGDADGVPNNEGIGTTDEYFAHTYQVPSWTLEVEPSSGQHIGLPGFGADYGGVNESSADGFILPESQIRRVREELAQSFATVYYKQAGPPSMQAMRIVDKLSDAVVFEAAWDQVDDRNRSLHVQQIQPLILGHQYTQWVSYNKPMRWRDDGEVVPFPGLEENSLDVNVRADVGNQPLDITPLGLAWMNQPGGAPGGYLNYEDDAYAIEFILPRNVTNIGLLNGATSVDITSEIWDMTGTRIDADPATVAFWEDGHWNNYEDSLGQDSDRGGADSTISIQMTDQNMPAPFVLEPGTAAAWGDTERNGEGFVLEMLTDTLAAMFWFTYNDAGEQDWYIAVGNVRGNRVVFPRVLRVSGGVFGDAFDPDLVTEEVVGSARFIWTDCDKGSMDWHIGNRSGRQNLQRLTSIMGLGCGTPQSVPADSELAKLSGPWGDPSHDGEGFTVEVLENGSALVFWFSFGPDGKRRWYFGIGNNVDGKFVFNNMLTTVGGIFGDAFDPDTVDELNWGTLELDLDCNGGTATYIPTEEGFEPGQQNIRKIIDLNGPGCGS